MSFRKTLAEINLDHLRHNCRLLMGLNQNMRSDLSYGRSDFFCPMVKANAYGHGVVEVSRVLVDEGVHSLGVSLVEEALQLRQSGCEVEILVFGGFSPEGALQLLEHNCTPVIGSWAQWHSWQQALQLIERTDEKRHPLHIKWDTGMSRMGFSFEDVSQVQEKILSSSLPIEVKGFCTHFMSGEDIQESEGDTFLQLKEFKKILDHLRDSGDFKEEHFVHCLNSSSALGLACVIKNKEEDKEKLSDVLSVARGMRPGLALYGVCPENVSLEGFDLRPVMSLRAEVIAVKKIAQGSRVSYGGTWQASRDSVVALVFCGYADGYPRSLSNKGLALYRGERVPQVGRVCMGYTLFDVTELSIKDLLPSEGDVFTLFGNDGKAALELVELSEQALMIPYEILTGVSSRVPRVYVSPSC